MTKDELLKSLSTDQSTALNALLVEQRDALTAAHQQNFLDAATANRAQLEKASAQTPALQAQITGLQAQIKDLADYKVNGDKAIAAVVGILGKKLPLEEEHAALFAVAVEVTTPEIQKQIDALRKQSSEAAAKADELAALPKA